VDINFVCTPRLSSGDLRRIIAKQCVLLSVSISVCALAGNLIIREFPQSAEGGGSPEAARGRSPSLCQVELERLEQRVGLLRSAASSRTEASRILAALGRSIPEGAWITSVHMRAHRVEIEGRALTEGDVQAFASRLEREESVAHAAVVSSTASAVNGDPHEFRVMAGYAAVH
jgi:hypothetical protein